MRQVQLRRMLWPAVILTAALLAGCLGARRDLVRTVSVGAAGEPARALAFSPDAASLVASSGAGLYLVDVESLDARWSLPGPAPATAAAFSPDGARLAAAFDGGPVALFDPATGQSVADLTPAGLGGQTVAVLAWSPSTLDRGSLLALGAADGTVVVLNFRDEGGQLVYDVARTLGPLGGAATALAYSPNAAMLATGDAVGEIVLWEAWSGQNLGALAGHQRGQAVTSLDWTPDGTRLLSGGQDGRLIVWDTIAASALTELDAHDAPVLAAAYSADGTAFGSIAADGTVIAWDALRAEPRQTLSGSTEGITGEPQSAVWAPDATWLAEVTAGGQLAVWDLEDLP